ncbi:MAG: hypothetical protein JXR37_19115 [Kiritimatiellae bacterium]|nr:hypothetical protein [Kiritimatiellia bacterium]
MESIGDDALTVYYRDAHGKLAERMLFRTDEASLETVEKGRPWSFDSPGADFKLAALNQPERFVLAVVLVDGDAAETLRSIRQPFDQEPGFGVTSINFNLKELLTRAETPAKHAKAREKQ